MSVINLSTTVVLQQVGNGAVTAAYSVKQGCSDFPTQVVNVESGTLTIPSGDAAAAADLIAQAIAAAAAQE